MAAETKTADINVQGNRNLKGANSGNYTWKITDDILISNMLSAYPAELFESNIFKIANLKWQILLYPNGEKQQRKGNVKIYIRLVEFPEELSTICTAFTIQCDNTMSANTNIKKFIKSADIWGWSNKTLLLSKWRSMKLKNISITISLKIQYIEVLKDCNYLNIYNLPQPQLSKTDNYKNKYSFNYNINSDTMLLIKSCDNGQRFLSPIFGGLWRLECNPKGQDASTNGYFGVFLVLCHFPPYISRSTVRSSISCNETMARITGTTEFNYNRSYAGKPKFMMFKDVKLRDSLSFKVSVNILSVSGFDRAESERVITDPVVINEMLSILSPAESIATEVPISSSLDTEEYDKKMDDMQKDLRILSKQVQELTMMLTEERKMNDIFDTKKGDDGSSNERHEAVGRWLKDTVGLGQYSTMFIANGFDSMDVIQHMEKKDLLEIGIDKLGHQKKILMEIERLKQ